MLTATIWFAVGLVVGWNVLPQPEWVKNLLIMGWNLFKEKVLGFTK